MGERGWEGEGDMAKEPSPACLFLLGSRQRQPLARWPPTHRTSGGHRPLLRSHATRHQQGAPWPHT